MFLLIRVSHVVYTRHGHDLGKRPCKLSCLLFCLKLACRSAKAQALCQSQIYHLMMKKRMSRLGVSLETTLIHIISVGSELKVTFARCTFMLLLGKTPVCLTVSFFCYTSALRAQGPKGVSFDASSQACCDGKSPGIKPFAFIGNKIKWFVWLGLGPIDCLNHA